MLKRLIVILIFAGLSLPMKAFSDLGIGANPDETALNDNTGSIADAPDSRDGTKENSVVGNSQSQKADSITNYNSSCKFNFLFYFIYKAKYDENGNLNYGEIEFEF